MPVGHPYVLSGAISIQALCPLFNRIVCLSGVKKKNITSFISFQPHTWHIICGFGRESEAGGARAVEDPLRSARPCAAVGESGFLWKPHDDDILWSRI